MLAFGSFPNRERAEAFLQEVQSRFPQHGGFIQDPHDVVLESGDTVHFERLEVYIERHIYDGWCQREREIEALVTEFGGEFEGV